MFANNQKAEQQHRNYVKQSTFTNLLMRATKPSVMATKL